MGTPAHAHLLRQFFQTVWPPDPRDADFAVAADVSGTTPDLCSVAVQNDRVIGYLGTLPLRLWDGGSVHSGHWFKGFMVVPEYQNGPIGFALLKELSKHTPTGLVTTVQPASWRLFQATGFTHLGAIQNRLRLLRPARVFRELDPSRVGLRASLSRGERALLLARRLGVAGAAGAILGQTLRAWSAVRGPIDSTIQIESAEYHDPNQYDALWANCRGTLRYAQVRDGEYVRSRYQGNPAYVLLEAREGGRLVGFTAVRRPRSGADPRLSGVGVALIADMLAHPRRRNVLLSLLAGAERTAMGLKADAILCSASHRALLYALSARAYLPIPATVQFLARVNGCPQLGALADWWLMRADGNADEGF